MTFHKSRHRRLTRGKAPSNALGHRLSPRLTVSLTAVEFIRLVALAERLGIPAAAVMRRAIAAYLAKFPPQYPQPDGGRDDQPHSLQDSERASRRFAQRPVAEPAAPARQRSTLTIEATGR